MSTRNLQEASAMISAWLKTATESLKQYASGYTVPTAPDVPQPADVSLEKISLHFPSGIAAPPKPSGPVAVPSAAVATPSAAAATPSAAAAISTPATISPPEDAVQLRKIIGKGLYTLFSNYHRNLANQKNGDHCRDLYREVSRAFECMEGQAAAVGVDTAIRALLEDIKHNRFRHGSTFQSVLAQLQQLEKNG